MYDTKRHSRRSGQRAAAVRQKALVARESSVNDELLLTILPSSSES
jgi:hypothetical protein